MSDIVKYLEDNQSQVAAVAAKGMDLVLLRNLTLEAQAKNPALKKCTPESILMFCKTCAEMGTTRIGQGGIWAVPFGTEMVPIPDWRFLIQMAIDAGAIISAHAEVVYENEADSIIITGGSFPTIQHNLKLDRKGKIIGAYCVTRTSETVSTFSYMTRAEIDEVRERAPGGNADAWTKWFGEQAKKTAVRRHMKKFAAAVPKLRKMVAIEDRASGYSIDGEVVSEEPIAAPTQLPAKTEKPKTTKKTTKSQPAKKAKETPKEEGAAAHTPFPIPEDAETVEGVIDMVKATPKKGKDGKDDYTVYGVILGGQRYGTFSDTVGKYAQECEKNGTAVTLSVVKSGNFWNLKGIWPQEQVETPTEVLPPEGENKDAVDDIPM